MVLDPSFRVCRVRYISNSNFAAAAAQRVTRHSPVSHKVWRCVKLGHVCVRAAAKLRGRRMFYRKHQRARAASRMPLRRNRAEATHLEIAGPGFVRVRVKVLLTKSQSAGPGASDALAARLENAGARPGVRAQVLKRRCCGVRRLSLRATGPASPEPAGPRPPDSESSLLS